MEKETKKADNFKYVVRVANSDLDGNKQLIMGLRKIKGLGFTFSNTICNLSGIDKSKKIGYLTETEVRKLTEIITNPKKAGIPGWFFNRKKNPETGEDTHVTMGDLDFSKDQDIKRLKKIKSYRGTRHMFGLPSRGQRTKSNFRKSKRKGGTLGVKRKK